MKQTRAMLAASVIAVLMAAAGARAATPLEGLLKGAAVAQADLRENAAKGLPDTINTAVSQSNTVGSNTVTGTITNVGSMNSNTGITTILQNTGNNTLFQTSTILNVTIH